MSLLLDALKKAADEKTRADAAADSKDELQAVTEQDENFDLSLDESALQGVEQENESQIENRKQTDHTAQEDYDRLSEVVSAHAGRENETISKTQSETVVRAADRAGGNLDYDVSDEALDLLIHKTNQDYQKNKVIWLVMVSVLSLAILVMGGVYFTEDMKSEVAFLESRHNQLLRTVREKTSKELLPDKSVIIENLVSDNDLVKKVEFTKKELAKKDTIRQEKLTLKRNTQLEPREVASSKSYADKTVLSIEKSQQADPVSLLLDEAWLAYDAGDYDQSDKIYQDVLGIEKNNRDALLGRAAIALKKKAFSRARSFYTALLAINPGDPDAVSAITNLAQTSNGEAFTADEAGDESSRKEQINQSEKYLKNVLLKNEQSPVLNFSLGSVYASQGRWALAQSHFFKAWVNDNNNAGYAYNLAVSLDQMGKANEAKRFYEECLRLSESRKVPFSKQSVLDRIVQIN